MIIKKFESFGQDSWEEITWNRFVDDFRKTIPLRKEEIFWLIDNLNIWGRYQVSFRNTYSIDVLITSDKDKENLKQKLEEEVKKQKSYIQMLVTSNSPKFRLIKTDDEWYITSINGRWYRCDEWGGLVQFLKKNNLLKNEN